MPRTSSCSACGKAVYRGKTSRAEITCHECRRKQADGSGKRRIPATCEECGAGFGSRRNGQSVTGWTRYCSLSCASKVKNRNRPRMTPEQRRARQKARRSARDRRRRQAIQTATWDGITDAEILKRDRWMCWICKRRIGKTFKYPHPRSPSIDHILPLSLGGDDTALNKKAAHLGCNMARGAGRPGEQMPMAFGLDPDVVLEPRWVKQARQCSVCGEPVKGKRCRLHMPVHYSTCQACERLFVHGKGNYVYCSAGCSRSARYVRHDQKIQTRPAHLRGLEAKALRDAGMSLDEIADRLGYSGAPYAAAAIARVTGQRSSRRTEPYVRQQRAGQRLTA